MIKIYKFLLGIGLCLMLIPGHAQVQVKQQKFEIPLLVGKDRNAVLRLKIDSKDALELTEVLINANHTNLDHIEKISVLYLSKDSAFVSNNKLQKAPVFSETTDFVKKEIKLKGALQLEEGANYLWLSLKLKPAAAMQPRVNLTVNAVRLNKKKVGVKKPEKAIAQRIGVAVRQHMQDNVHTHRIPGLATANDGTLLATYDARYENGRDLQGHMDIGLSRSLDKGQTWLPMQVTLDMGEWGGLPQQLNGVSDAAVLVDKNTGTIYIAGLWMYGVINEDGKWLEGLTEKSKEWNHQWRNKGSQPGFDVKQTSQFLITKSSDHGKTWSEPINLTQMCKKEEWWLWAPAPGQGITLKDGTLVFPTQGRDATGKAFSNITYSKDGGKTWKTSNPATDESTTENMAVELSDGTLMLNMRANSNKGDTTATNGRAIAVTNDLGESWTAHSTSHKALQEPVCMASIIRHDFVKDGIKKSILLFCNPDSKVTRNNISIKVSYDDGKTWPKTVLLDDQKGRGYSCLTSVDEDTIGLIYEGSQADLVYQSFDLKEFL